jgi:hypothetical protein
MLFSVLYSMNLLCWRPFYELSDRPIPAKENGVRPNVNDTNTLFEPLLPTELLSPPRFQRLDMGGLARIMGRLRSQNFIEAVIVIFLKGGRLNVPLGWCELSVFRRTGGQVDCTSVLIHRSNESNLEWPLPNT